MPQKVFCTDLTLQNKFAMVVFKTKYLGTANDRKVQKQGSHILEKVIACRLSMNIVTN